MKLSENFLTQTIGEEIYLVPTSKAGFNGMVRGNGTLGIIIKCLKKECTEDDILAEMKRQFEVNDTNIAKVRDDISRAVGKLREIGALEE
ncbi:MAG: hypothetical protein IJU57_05995 [Clostridia bacterium]|nr:hypothetical protein [Clostridia bacterium]